MSQVSDRADGVQGVRSQKLATVSVNKVPLTEGFKIPWVVLSHCSPSLVLSSRTIICSSPCWLPGARVLTTQMGMRQFHRHPPPPTQPQILETSPPRDDKRLRPSSSVLWPENHLLSAPQQLGQGCWRSSSRCSEQGTSDLGPAPMSRGGINRMSDGASPACL
jgi:hypothetical protein